MLCGFADVLPKEGLVSCLLVILGCICGFRSYWFAVGGVQCIVPGSERRHKPHAMPHQVVYHNQKQYYIVPRYASSCLQVHEHATEVVHQVASKDVPATAW